MTTTSVLSYLPGELLLTIVGEWIGNALTFCAFDAAMCNRNLREQYLWSLQSYSSAILSKIHFETAKSSSNPHQCVPYVFSYWCMKRGLSPKSLSLAFLYPPLNPTEPENKRKESNDSFDIEVFSNIEMLEDCYLINLQSKSFPIHNLFTLFPKLKVLHVHCNNMYTLSDFKPDNYPLFPCPLLYLELNKAVFPRKKSDFLSFVRVFSNLEVLKLICCRHINLKRILFIICYAKHLLSLHYRSCYNYADRQFCKTPDINDIVQPNFALKELVLDLNEMKQGAYLSIVVDESDNETDSDKDERLHDRVCAVLTQCPFVEKISLHNINFLSLVDFREPPYSFFSVIEKNWRHLQSLELVSTTKVTEIKRDYLEPIAKACGSILTCLRFTCMTPTTYAPSDTAISFLCESFPRLEILELCYDLPLTLIDVLMQASFRHTLHTLIVVGLKIRPEETIDQIFLEAFPALKTLKLQFCKYVQVMTLFPAMTQITQLELDHLRRCPPIRSPSAAADETESLIIMNDHPAEDFTMLDLSGYTALQHLTLVSFYFYPEEFANILQLPTLRTLKLVDIWAKHEHILFHPSNYPSSHLAPLHTLDVSEKIESREDKLAFTEESLCVFLYRFASTLSIVKAPKNRWGLEESVWFRVKEDHRYRVTLSS